MNKKEKLNEQDTLNAVKIEPNRFKVTEINERMRHSQKYRVLRVFDPFTKLTYDKKQIVALNLIDFESSKFRLPSNPNELLEIDEAIDLGYLVVKLIDEQVEFLNEAVCYEQIETSKVLSVFFHQCFFIRCLFLFCSSYKQLLRDYYFYIFKYNLGLEFSLILTSQEDPNV